MRRILVPLLFGVIGTVILINLGLWQLRRAEWKEAMLAEIQAGIDAAPVPLPAEILPEMKYLPVTLTGQTTGDEILILSGTRARGGGYQVISSFVTEDGRRILLDRGFVDQDHRHDPRPAVGLQVIGNLHWPKEKTSSSFEPNLAENIWFARDVPAMAAHLGTEPVLVVAARVTGDAQGADPIPIAIEGIPNNHMGYAVQWFLIAATWAGMTVALIWRIRRRTY